MQPQEFDDAKLLWKMCYAGQCFKQARAAAECAFQGMLQENSTFVLRNHLI